MALRGRQVFEALLVLAQMCNRHAPEFITRDDLVSSLASVGYPLQLDGPSDRTSDEPLACEPSCWRAESAAPSGGWGAGCSTESSAPPRERTFSDADEERENLYDMFSSGHALDLATWHEINRRA